MRRHSLLILWLLITALSLAAFPHASSSTEAFSAAAHTYVEATGTGVAPSGKTGAWAKVMARRGAIVDLQRNLLRELARLNVDSSALPTSLQGFIKGVEMNRGEWDGKVYKVRGHVRVENGHVSVPIGNR